MKTTIDLPETLLAEAKRVAARQSTTIGALVEAGLRKELRDRESTSLFRLQDASFRGRGLRAELAGDSWEPLRELVYEERGG